MSMPVKNFRAVLLSTLPMILLLITVLLVAWLIMQPEMLPAGKQINLHQIIRNAPNQSSVFTSTGSSFRRDETALRDPLFRKKDPRQEMPQPIEFKEPEELVEITLTTIARGAHGKYCMLNGKIFHESQKGAGFTVQKIHPDHVIFSTAEQSFALKPGQKITLDSGRAVENTLPEGKQELGEPASPVDNIQPANRQKP